MKSSSLCINRSSLNSQARVLSFDVTMKQPHGLYACDFAIDRHSQIENDNSKIDPPTSICGDPKTSPLNINQRGLNSQALVHSLDVTMKQPHAPHSCDFAVDRHSQIKKRRFEN